MLGVSETRWTGSGTRNLASGHQIIYSGRDDDYQSNGVGLIITKDTSKCILGWKPYSDRVLSARFHSKYAKLTVVVCYGPTEDKED